MLENNLIKLRALEPKDVDLLYKWENNTDIWNISNTLQPYSKHVLIKYIESSHFDILTTAQLRLIIDIKLNPAISIGTIDLFDINFIHKRAGIGILIADKNYLRKGFASQSLDLLHEYCKFHLEMYQLYCDIDSNNAESIALFESKGYKQTGIKKSWKKSRSGRSDILFYQYIL